MPKATKAASEATAARILETARALFAARGFAGTPVDEVARHSGVTRGAVYHHYGSRQGLFAAVHSAVQAAVSDSVLAVTEGIEDPGESLRAGSFAFLRACIADDVRQILLIDAPAVMGWDRWRAADAENSALLLREVLQELAHAGRLRSADTEQGGGPDSEADVDALVPLLSGAMNEAALWAAQSEDPVRAVGRAETALAGILSSLVEP